MKKKLILLILLLLTISVGVTYAIFKWTSSNSDVTFNVEGCYITYDAGSNISGASFGPALSKNDTNNVISKKISMTPECAGVTANLTLKVDSIDDGLKEQSFSFTLGASGENALYKEPPVNAVTLVEGLDKGETGDSGSGVYKVTHSAIASGSSATGAEIPAVTDYRYYGPSPNNYICLDMEGQSTCADKHLYRIIGSIYEENESTNRLKVIKATPLTDGTTKGFSWNHQEYNELGGDNIWANITSGNYSNSLTSGCTLMILLNSGLWWNGTSGSYNNSETKVTVNFTNYKLSNRAKGYIGTSRYYLGGYNNDGIKTSEMYEYERGTNRNHTDMPLYWDGMIGLMYPSDYGYVAGNVCATGTDLHSYAGGCRNNDWLRMTDSRNYSNYFEWLMSPNFDNTTSVASIEASGSVYGPWDSLFVYSVRPTFYLTSTTSIISGTGTSSDPYIISK